jgi:glyoxylate reductase
MKPKLLLTRILPEPAMRKLEPEFELIVNPEDRVMTKAEIIAAIPDCEILLSLLTDTIDAEILDAAPKLKGISNYAVGYNNIDLKAANSRRLPVSNTPGVLTEATADMAWALMLSVARRIPESDRFLREGKFQGWGPMLFLGGSIYGTTIGVVGLGRIGLAVAKRAVGFGMRILYYDREAHPAFDRETGAQRVELDYLLRHADFVTLHVPLLPETRHFIDDRAFGLMKSSAYLINTARGPVVDEEALVRALRTGAIAGAGLDVYENEPAVHPDLIDMPNTVLLPHTASATVQSRTEMGLLAAENAIAMIHNRRPPTIVNPEVLERGNGMLYSQ